MRHGSDLRACYRIRGDLARLRVPRQSTPARRDGLWEHTCCELFLGAWNGSGYHEFNFSPSGEWAAYAFEAYRRPGFSPAGAPPSIDVRASPGLLELDAAVEAPAPGRLRVGLSVVIEETSGARSYWALRHPAGKPDFHHAEAFALELE